MISTLLLAALLMQEPPQGQALTPGVTVRVWDLGEDPLDRLPTVTEGQNSNYYAVHDQIDFKDGFKNDDEDLKDRFAGEVRAWIKIEQKGGYTFRLTCDDGAELYVDGKRTIVTDKQDAYSGEDRIDLEPGLHAIRIPFYENAGNFSLRLQWRKPSDESLSVVPQSSFVTEGGQTFVVSPGPKKWYYGNDPNRPGDGRPLTDIHPAMVLENFRGPDFRPPVGAMEFLPDGRLAITTWSPEGAVYFLGNLHGEKPGGVTVHRFASGLGEPLGLRYWKGDLYVTQKEEVTRLRDTDGDDVADVYETIASGWSASHNYHEFTFNLVPLNGKFYISTSLPLKSGVTSYTPGSNGPYASGFGPGSLIEVDPLTKTWRTIARGARTPNGMNIGTDGLIYFCDNQGSWMPSSRLNIVREGGFYAHQDEPGGKTPSEPAIVWMPQGEIGNSPSEMLVIPDSIYRGQMLVGDVTYGGLQRIFLENVDGVYQGTVFRFSQGLEAGINRLIWGPDGCLYVGGIGADGDWNHLGRRFGLQRLRWNPNGGAFEVLKVESRQDGLLLTFTEPVDPDSLKDFNNYQIRSWRYNPTYQYGGPKLDQVRHSVEQVVGSSDGRQVFLKIPDLKEGKLIYIRLKDLTAASSNERLLWSTEAWTTLNKIRNLPGPAFTASRESMPDMRRAEVLYDGGSTAKLQQEKGGEVKWKQEHGELVVDEAFGSITTKDKFGDCILSFDWMSPPGGQGQMAGNSGVKLQGRYEVQILGTQTTAKPQKNEAGSIYEKKAPDQNVSLGPGVWQSYVIDFNAPRWSNGKKIAHARMTVWWNGVKVHDSVEIDAATGSSGIREAEGDWPILFQSHASDANAPVRFRNIRVLRK